METAKSQPAKRRVDPAPTNVHVNCCLQGSDRESVNTAIVMPIGKTNDSVLSISWASLCCRMIDGLIHEGLDCYFMYVCA